MSDDHVMTSSRPSRGRVGAAPTDLADLFAAVGDPTRLSLLRYVTWEEHCVTQCSKHIGLTHSAASKQLKALAAVGLLSSRPHGRRRYYGVTDPEAVTTILDAAESLIENRSL